VGIDGVLNHDDDPGAALSRQPDVAIQTAQFFLFKDGGGESLRRLITEDRHLIGFRLVLDGELLMRSVAFEEGFE